MKRRDFIKTSAASAALISTSGLYFTCGHPKIKSGKIDCFQQKSDIPIIKEVDVFIAGGSSAAVSAAIKIANFGGSVFLATDHPYLGEDICGTFNYWDVGKPHTELAKTLFADGIPKNPIYYKRILDNALLEHKIDFLFSSFVTDVIKEETGQVSGVIISNRSGQQGIKANAIIDATPHATLARELNLLWRSEGITHQDFRYRVVSDEKKSSLPVKTFKADFALKESPVSIFEYTINQSIEEDTFREYQEIEQKFRDLTWTSGQMDSADNLCSIPYKTILSKSRNVAVNINIDTVNLASFQPEDTENVYLLNGYVDLSKNAAEDLLKPCHMMQIAERIGLLALKESKEKVCTLPPLFDTHGYDFVSDKKMKSTYDFVRPHTILDETNRIKQSLRVLGEYDVVVIGGGIAGAPAGIGAAQQGAKTLVVEYLHGLGGMGTLGLIGSYFHGYRDGYTKIIDDAVENYGGKEHPRTIKKEGSWVKDWKMEYFRSELRKAGADIWFGAIGIGAFVRDNSVEGVVIATPFGKGVVLAKNVIDSTGSADIAIAAGAQFRHTDKDCLAVQGAGLPPIFEDRSYNNTDWTFINDTDIVDVWRTFVTGKKKYDDGYYDVGKLPQTRERRRIIGDHEISVLDLYNNRTYPDTVSIHKSSFDTHGFTNDPFFNLKPPRGAHLDEIAYVPIRSLIPKGLKNIIVTGLGASADRDAMPVIRMQPCLQNQGYTVGHIAAKAVKENIDFRDVDLKPIQKKMVELGSLPASVLTDEDNYPPKSDVLEKALQSVPNNLDQLELVLWNTPKGLKLLKTAFKNATDKNARLQYAYVLATYGIADGWDILSEKIKSIKSWDKGWRYTGMGQFGPCMSLLDSMIIALGNTRKKEGLPVLFEKAKMLKPDQEFSHFRALALAFENFKDPKATDVLYSLLHLEGVQGHAMTTIQKAKEVTDSNWTNTEVRNHSLRELVLARALYRTGDKDGLGKKILKEYAKDLKGHYARHALDVLMNG